MQKIASFGQHALNRTRAWLQRQSARHTALRALHVVNAVCATHLFVEYVGSVHWVHGPSMVPTMAEKGEMVIENRLSFWLNPNGLQRGDLVTFTSPLTAGRTVCKRILGLPGDIICVDPTGEYAPSTEHTVIPKGHIWVIGDNAAISRDSRTYGPVPLSLVRGTLVARVYPFKDRTIFGKNVTVLE
ncbi:LexA/Signal peptidase [Dentipellis sp. KUC8613]|nr:LexA/Signal peptidase [Dentipellis sp. KUC8613]